MKGFAGLKRICGAKRVGRRLIFLMVPTVFIFYATSGSYVNAQTPDQINQLLNAINNKPVNVTTPTPPASSSPPSVTSPPSGGATQAQQLPPASELPPSRLEKIMSTRAGTVLRQFGYDQLSSEPQTYPSQSGAVQDNYILGLGDELIISLRGQENSEYRAIVDRGGQVLLPRLNPIPAAGRTLQDFRVDLDAAVHRAYISTNAFVSLGTLHQISVMVSGEVKNPGLHLMTGLSSVVDAILTSGGIKKTGSLRSIKLMRQGKVHTIDLYGVLSSSVRTTLALLTDGDRIIVPPLGRAVAVTGWVRQPGIYELAPGAGAMSTHSLISLAGGLVVRGTYRLSVLRVQPSGTSAMEQVSQQAGSVNDSEILFVQPGAQKIEQQATLSGETALAGQYSTGKLATLADMLKAPGALGDTPYTLFGLISRRNPATNLRTLMPFTPVAVLNGAVNMPLEGDDVVRVFSTQEAQLLSAVAQTFEQLLAISEQQVRAPSSAEELAGAAQQPQGTQAQANGASFNNQQFAMPLTERQIIAQLSHKRLGAGGILVDEPSQDSQPQNDSGHQSQNDQSENSKQQPQNLQIAYIPDNGVALNREVRTFGELARQLNVDPLVLIHFLMDNEATIGGAVRGAGDYLVGPHASLDALIAAAGGTQDWADLSGVEVTSTAVNRETGAARTTRQLLSLRSAELANYIVKPQDEVRFNQAYTKVGAGQVTLQGEVRFPGTYKIERGEHLSDLLLRAGGLTDQSYPYGTVFLRKSVAAIERAGLNRAADEMQNMVLTSGTGLGTQALSASGVQALIDELRKTKPLGRISIIADPVMLAESPTRDPLLESGDVIFIPQRPDTVTVLGQVLQPGTVPFASKMSVADYVERVGGYNEVADESLTFVVFPDGTSRRVESSWLDLNPDTIPPGSTIVVPRDLSPISLRQIFLDVTQAFSQVAVTAASLAVISRR